MSARPISATAGSSGRAALGGTAGNEVLTSATAVVLTLLLAAEGVTILDTRRPAAREHMFIGMC